MIAAFVIGLWLLICGILLLANHAFKLSCQRQRDASPDMGADIHGAGGGELFTGHNRASAQDRS